MRRRDVLSLELGDLHRGGERLSGTLGRKPSLVGLPVIRCAVADAVQRCAAGGLVLANGRHHSAFPALAARSPPLVKSATTASTCAHLSGLQSRMNVTR